MPSCERLSVHRDVLAALACLRTVYQGLVVERGRAAANVQREKERATALLSQLPEPYRGEVAPILSSLRSLNLADRRERVRSAILELNHALLTFARRLMR